MVKILKPLLKELNILPAGQPKKSTQTTTEPKKLGRPKKVKPESPRINFRDGLIAQIWLADRMYSYIPNDLHTELTVHEHTLSQYPHRVIGVWRIKKLIRPSLRQIIHYQLNQLN